MVVIGRNGRARLERCLSALMATAGVGFEVIVADGGTDGEGTGWILAAYPQVRVLQARRRGGLAAAARQAAAVANGRYLAFLASHAVVDPGWLHALVDALAADGSIAAACSTLLWRDQPELLCASGGRLTWLGVAFDEGESCPAAEAEAPAACRETSFPTDAAMLISRRDWEGSGGFDPAFRAGNADADLGWRLWLLGRRVIVCGDSQARADGSQAEAGERRHGWVGAGPLRQTIRMAIKHYPPRFLLHVLWWTARARAASGAWRSLGLALAWNLLHLPGTLLRRRWIQRRRHVAHEDLFKRGVILEVVEPPRPPTRVAGTAMSDPAEWIPSGVLLPGTDSALGRLGVGWYPAQLQDGAPARWTAGVARCALRVTPDAAGVLQAHVRLADQAASDGAVTVGCNGTSVSGPCSGSAWQRIDLRVRARSDGLLDVLLRSPVRPPGSDGNPVSARVSGCAVREIRFVPDTPAPASPPRTISVIIPTFNRWPILEETLAALAAQTMREFQVIIVDDGSTDGTWESLAAWRRGHPELEIKAIRQANLKPGRARNRGLQEAAGDLVLFLGDDIIPRHDLLAQHLAKHQAVGETIGVLGLTEWDDARMEVTPFLEFVNSDGPQFAYAHFRDGGDVFFTGFYTANISLPRWVLGSEPFHPAFTFVDWEDIELGYRLSLRGVRLIYHAGARAAHFHPTSIRQFYRRQVHVGRTIGVILGLHPELAANPAMPALTPHPWFRWARHLAPAVVPLLERWDRSGHRCPIRLYRNLLLCAFWTGRRQALRGSGTPVTGTTAVAATP